MSLPPSDRILLQASDQKKNVYTYGFMKASWKRLPMAEMFAILCVGAIMLRKYGIIAPFM